MRCSDCGSISGDLVCLVCGSDVFISEKEYRLVRAYLYGPREKEVEARKALDDFRARIVEELPF